MEYKWTVLSNTTLGTLMSSLDTNIVIISLPTIARELPGTTILDLLWILMGYTLVTAAVVVNFGRLSDMFGRVRLYTLGFAIFTGGSALCSISQTGSELIGFRLIQGIGAAFLFSNSGAIITDAFPENERGRALGINQVAIVAGSVAGLVLGGILTYSIGWRSIFYVNVPIGIGATIWAHHNLRELSTRKGSRKLDIWGNVTFASSIGLVLTAITIYSTDSSGFLTVLFLIFSGTILFIIFIYLELRSDHPMFDLRLFKIRQFAAGNIAIFLNSLARGAVTFVLVFYLQGPTMGLDPFVAGLYLTPMSLSLSFFGPISGFISDRYGARIVSTVGLLVSAAGFLLLTHIGARETFEGLLIPLILIGSGMGIFAAPNRASIMNSCPPSDRGIASGMSSTLVNVGNILSMGIAFYIMSMTVSMPNLARIFIGSYSAISDKFLANSFLRSIDDLFYFSTAILLIAIIPSALRGRKIDENNLYKRGN
ncbi:MAG: MFS transporter [Thermoplasmatales archaeon]